ncbi:SpoIIE family protein phosphatase [Streptomyces sp. NPDC006879]|uniref:SpoIIE family protein phosphatase n=1 Tax=Streptomyces sp. NPDC006879 TaxID=3364767 RepID=UPI0036855C61
MGQEGTAGEPAWAMFTQAQALAALARIDMLPSGAVSTELIDCVTDYRLVRQVLDRAHVGVAVLDRTLRYRYVNATLAELNGVPVGDHLGRRVAEVLPGINSDSADTALTAVLKDGRPRAITVRGTTRSSYPAGPRWWHNSYHRLDDAQGQPLGVAAVVVEITTDRVILRSLDRERNRLALLDQAALHIGTTLDVQRTCEELTQVLVPQLADIAVVDVLELERFSPAGPLLMRRLALTSTAALRRVGHHLGAPGAVLSVTPTSAVGRCLDEQRPVVTNGAAGSSTPGFEADSEWAVYCRLGLRAGCYVPLTATHDTIGVVALGRGEDSAPFSDEDLALVGELARRAASSIDNARRYAEQRDTAVLLQRALLSKSTTPHSDVECASRYLPSGAGAEVGGDWYDTIALPDGTTLLVVGDVMGHGMDAAAAMAEYRATVRALAYQRLSPERILTETDALVHVLDLERIATCLIVLVNPAAGRADCACAGHLPALLVTPGHPSRLMDEIPVGPPLGVAASQYELGSVALPPGSALLMYTDGLVERRGQDIEDSLAELLALELDPALGLEQLIDTVLSGLAGDPKEDDVALLVARPLPG